MKYHKHYNKFKQQQQLNIPSCLCLAKKSLSIDLMINKIGATFFNIKSQNVQYIGQDLNYFELL